MTSGGVHTHSFKVSELTRVVVLVALRLSYEARIVMVYRDEAVNEAGKFVEKGCSYLCTKGKVQ